MNFKFNNNGFKQGVWILFVRPMLVHYYCPPWASSCDLLKLLKLGVLITNASYCE